MYFLFIFTGEKLQILGPQSPTAYTVDSGNSKRLNSKQSLINKHFLVQTSIVSEHLI